MSKINNPTKISLAAAAQLCDTFKKPVIFWDTCALLDIMRLPIPDRKHSVSILEKLIEIRNKIVAKDIVSMSSVVCIIEFNDHIDNWKQILNTEAKRLSKPYNDFISFINKVNVGVTPIPNIDLSAHGLENILDGIILSITKETYFISEDAQFSQFAEFRTFYKFPPAKVKGEYKDCYIWDTCLELNKNITDKSFPSFFMSSNTTDYAASNKINFEPTLIVHEATQNNITYLPNFNFAHGQLKQRRIL
ncbi:MAG TPA: hypothetical protein VK835_11720 [Bacteroidia bacterium]|jgi:hypothetical protein|nr:hypothetical protein [Bacteroidia bacterium]